ncbi:MAG TPA: hypothetical protein VL948_20920, partial [Verrucomicrobiae bacterium]|nr:hypothetical protein [Verrucomicrobiae bacterium]
MAVKKTLVAVAMMAAALCGTMASPALAATSGSERFILFGGGDSQTVVATGAFFGTGQSFPIDEDNDLFVFADGTFHVNHPQTGGHDSFNDVACIGTSTFSGTYSLSQGTGAYAGISG